jgi:hypothetical protein
VVVATVISHTLTKYGDKLLALFREIKCMTFRNTASLFFIFLSLLSCKGVQYYQSGTNPAGISVVLQGPDHFYTNTESEDKIVVGVVNHNSQPIQVPTWWIDFTMIGQSRFYKKELTMKYPVPEGLKGPLSIAPGDTLLLFSVPVQDFLNPNKGWLNKGKASYAPHMISAKQYYPYVNLTAEFLQKIPSQNEGIRVRSNTLRINIIKYNEPKLVGKKTELSLTSDVQLYSTTTQNGNLVCKITNTGEYPIPLFNDPGSVRFRVFAYNPNRTSIMYTQYILNNGQLPVQPVSIASKSTYTITIPLKQLLFSQRPVDAQLFWTWNKKDPPVSPLIYGKSDMAMSTELWFGVVVDGQEFLSNTVSLNIDSPNKKSPKKSQ